MKTQHYIYFIQAGPDRPIKIGITKNVMDRYMVMQTNNPDELKLLGLVRGTLKTETSLHQQFKDINIRGEWYWPTEKLLAYISQLPQEMCESFNKAKDGSCECGNRTMHMKMEGGDFTGYCRACLMVKDGRMEKLIERLTTDREIKDPDPCKVCGRPEIYLRKGRCPACCAYLKRTGVDRPEELIHRRKTCSNCNCLQKGLCRGLCRKCYYHQKTYGQPRSLHSD